MNRETVVSYIVHEGICTRLERINRRLWITVLLLIILLVGSNIGWLIYESQWECYEETTLTQEAESESGDVIINGTGDLSINGER